jgi:hypothetical protein
LLQDRINVYLGEVDISEKKLENAMAAVTVLTDTIRLAKMDNK